MKNAYAGGGDFPPQQTIATTVKGWQDDIYYTLKDSIGSGGIIIIVVFLVGWFINAKFFKNK